MFRPTFTYVYQLSLTKTSLISTDYDQAFPFDPNPDWSRFYSSGKEIHEYIHRITRKWNLDRDVKLNHEVKEARWMNDRGQWRISVASEGRTWEEYADVLLSGQGVLV